MRETQVIEEELMEIASGASDETKIERIIAWCTVHPDEVPIALHMLLDRKTKT